MFSRAAARSAFQLATPRSRPLFAISSTFAKATASKFPSNGAQNRSAVTAAATTRPISQSEAQALLTTQRKLRPVSPHLSIYQPQLTWYGSITNRITGGLVAGGFYAFMTAYLISPMVGWHLESATIAAAFGAWPVVAKVGVKGALALPFLYHSFNGVRHLVWDTGRELSIKGVYRSGYVVLGLTAVGTVYLALL